MRWRLCKEDNWKHDFTEDSADNVCNTCGPLFLNLRWGTEEGGVIHYPKDTAEVGHSRARLSDCVLCSAYPFLSHAIDRNDVVLGIMDRTVRYTLYDFHKTVYVASDNEQRQAARARETLEMIAC